MMDTHCSWLLWRILERHYALCVNLDRLGPAPPTNTRYTGEAALALAERLRKSRELFEATVLQDFEEQELMACLERPHAVSLNQELPDLGRTRTTMRLLCEGLERSEQALKSGSEEAFRSAVALTAEFTGELMRLSETQDKVARRLLTWLLCIRERSKEQNQDN